MTIFFTSDHHWGHANILKYCNRPFSSVEEMDEIMIQRWNSVVSKFDTVYHLGDFCLCNDAKPYLSRLHGKIRFVIPNFHHDKNWLENKPDLPNVEYLPPIWVEKFSKDIFIVMCHYPFAVFERQHYGAFMLYGHCHDKNFSLPGFSMNVGVDHHDFYPVYFEEVKRYMINLGWTPGWKAEWIE